MTIRKTCCSFWLLSFLLCYSVRSFSALEIRNEFSDFDLGLWNGQGDVTLSQQACIISYSGFFRANDYRISARMNAPAASSAAPFQLFSISNSNVSIPFNAELRDLFTNQQQTLSPDVFSNNMTYQIGTCTFGGNSAELRFDLLASDLYQVPAGDYRVSLDIEARRVNNGGNLTGQSDTQQNLRGRIQIPSLIQISGLNDINLGTYDGLSPSLFQNESFCIYTNTANYTITTMGSNNIGSPNTYSLVSGSNNVDYRVKVHNSSDASNESYLLNGATTTSLAANQSLPLSRNCSVAGDNAAVYVEIQGADLSAVPAGSYSDVLTLRVAPI